MSYGTTRYIVVERCRKCHCCEVGNDVAVNLDNSKQVVRKDGLEESVADIVNAVSELKAAVGKIANDLAEAVKMSLSRHAFTTTPGVVEGASGVAPTESVESTSFACAALATSADGCAADRGCGGGSKWKDVVASAFNDRASGSNEATFEAGIAPTPEHDKATPTGHGAEALRGLGKEKSDTMHEEVLTSRRGGVENKLLDESVAGQEIPMTQINGINQEVPHVISRAEVSDSVRSFEGNVVDVEERIPQFCVARDPTYTRCCGKAVHPGCSFCYERLIADESEWEW